MAIIDAGDHSLTLAKHVLSRVLGAAVARNVASRHINMYSLEGKGATALDLSRYADIGAPDSISVGTEYTGEAAFGSTAVTITPSRRANGGTIDKDVYLRRVGGYTASDVANALNALGEVMSAPADFELQMTLIERAFGAEIRQLTAAHYEALEIELVGLFDNFASSVGSSGSNMTISNFEDALATIEGASSLPHEDIVACLDPRQVADLRADLRGSNNSGTPMSSDLGTILQYRPGIPAEGLRGAVLGVPVYQFGPEARLTANAGADVVGALFLRGEGDPEESGAGKPGAFAFVQSHGPQIAGLVHPNSFGVRLVVDWSWALGERVDAWGCAVITDAP